MDCRAIQAARCDGDHDRCWLVLNAGAIGEWGLGIRLRVAYNEVGCMRNTRVWLAAEPIYGGGREYLRAQLGENVGTGAARRRVAEIDHADSVERPIRAHCPLN